MTISKPAGYWRSNDMFRMLFALLIGLFAASPLYGVINPKLQPPHLADRYLNVLSCRVTSVDIGELTAVLKVEGVSKGDLNVKEVRVR